MARQGKRMIGIYVDEALYDEIKQTAADRGLSIKDYLVGLHQGRSQVPPSQLEMRLERIERALAGFSSPAREPSPRPQRPSTPSRTADTGAGSGRDVADDPRFAQYLDSFYNRRQREAIRATLQVIVDHGGSTTSSVIKRERGFTRTTIANRQIDRLVRDGVLIKDDSVTPYVVTLAPEWR